MIETILIAKHQAKSMSDFVFQLHNQNMVGATIANTIQFANVHPYTKETHELDIAKKYPDLIEAISRETIERTINQRKAIHENKQAKEEDKLRLQQEKRQNNPKEKLKQILFAAKELATDFYNYQSILSRQGITVYERGKEISYAVVDGKGKITKYRGSSLDATLAKEALLEKFKLNKQQPQTLVAINDIQKNNQVDKSTNLSATATPLRNIDNRQLYSQLLSHFITEDPAAETVAVSRLNNQENAENVQSPKKQDRYHTMHQIITAMQSAKRDDRQVQLRAFKENLQTNKIQLILLYKNSKIYGGYYQKRLRKEQSYEYRLLY